MNRLRRAWQQFLHPSAQYDLLTDSYLVPVSAELLNALSTWSDPVQVKVEHGPQWPGVNTDFHLVVRTAAPMTILMPMDKGRSMWVREDDHEGTS